MWTFSTDLGTPGTYMEEEIPFKNLQSNVRTHLKLVVGGGRLSNFFLAVFLLAYRIRTCADTDFFDKEDGNKYVREKCTLIKKNTGHKPLTCIHKIWH